MPLCANALVVPAQRTLDGSIDKQSAMNDIVQQEAYVCLVRWMAEADISFRSVTYESFVQFTTKLNAGFKPPGEKGWPCCEARYPNNTACA